MFRRFLKTKITIAFMFTYIKIKSPCNDGLLFIMLFFNLYSEVVSGTRIS
jgi:hypothetical protein